MSTFTSLLSKPVLLILLLLQFLVISSSTSLDLGMHSSKYCNGSIAECNEEHEMLMESEISRRFLAEGRMIGYGSLKPDQPACNGGKPGASYSGQCLPPESNAYRRGCSKAHYCRSNPP
ncbi:hypothetical protein Sjap_009070 [Stephania japonica]|uniref:Rapid ALkalinization Factor n=1 Tax=Stephania japonica TaxID=461633 RepID=A0AAP0PF31_9MAGN